MGLPDDASREAASLLDPSNDRTVLIDASTAFRVDSDWTYGFPELSPQQRTALSTSKRISNSGCYPTGFHGLTKPQVGSFAQGMVVSVPLHYAWLKEGTTGEIMHSALSAPYEGSKFVKVMPLGEGGAKDANLLERGAFLRPDTLADTNNMELFVFHNDESGQAVLCARLDNLGKGASGAAVQNMNIALGLDESIGL